MKRLVLATSIVLLVAAAIWFYGRRDALRLQWDCYQVTSARSYEDFRQRIDLFQRESKSAEHLVRWSRGGRPATRRSTITWLTTFTIHSAVRSCESRVHRSWAGEKSLSLSGASIGGP